MLRSPTNPELKTVAALHKRSEREATGLFLIEGRPEIERALAAGVQIRTLYWSSGAEPLSSPSIKRTIEVGESAFEKIAYGRDGNLAVAITPDFGLDRLQLSTPPLVLVVEAIEKPGNLGAILRSADGAGASVVVADPTTDLVNPNVVRASLGTLFTVPVAVATTTNTIVFLKERSITIVAATVGAGMAPWDLDLTKSIAIAIGNENEGLSGPWLGAADYQVTLPMTGEADSLNASVAAAVLMFETVRQRSRS